MKRIILFIIFINSFAFSAIDECKTDVYFGNGILTSPSQAQHAAYVTLQLAVKSLYGTEKEMKKHIGKFDYAYNSTHGEGSDLLESALQKLIWFPRCTW